ncbi:MAG: DNA photolyase family protein [Gammaproteobacteria bacterium]|nr:DNA photolyase family protein [Gammaproteobacteria bacterium]MDH4254328.1 DNA photolyase family protein [Gammaproteobacteria bacterium]MDH5309620.1 DNA photolyase family protein [Gammaproteobacteria bacterium]
MPDQRPVIAWFRQDLRLDDNPAFHAAAEHGGPVLPVYVLDDDNAGEWAMGAASRWWLHRSLAALAESLDGHLYLLRGNAATLLPELARATRATAVHWNRCYEPWRIARDQRIKSELKDAGVTVRSHNGSLLFEPQLVAKADGTPYKVFTPFYRNGCLRQAPAPREPLPRPSAYALATFGGGLPLEKLSLLPDIPWYRGMAAEWNPGERGASDRLARFLHAGIRHYREGRNRPDQAFVSRLSPHLHFGEISPHTVWHAAKTLESDRDIAAEIDHFLSELGWREFSHNLLYHWPGLPRENLQRKFNRFPWREDEDALRRWQRGLTGYPIVDAGMRELWRTGYMHNRVRMIVGSFLVKNLLLDWRHGEDWFWDTLVDADLANNSASWQWIAGCGADAAPYFRIFNPVAQGRKFDPDGDYVRRYVPELGRLPDRYLHAPWEAPAGILQSAGVTLGADYPAPIVDLKASRERALDAFRSLTA